MSADYSHSPAGPLMDSGSRPSRLHYAWVVAGVTFLVLLVTAGIRATPGVLMLPLESEYGWSDAAISVITAARSGSRAPYASSPGLRG